MALGRVVRHLQRSGADGGAGHDGDEFHAGRGTTATVTLPILSGNFSANSYENSPSPER